MSNAIEPGAGGIYTAKVVMCFVCRESTGMLFNFSRNIINSEAEVHFVSLGWRFSGALGWQCAECVARADERVKKRGK